ncbi:hypothetical protein BJY04DRAFT_191513 [Aspergillus karnatakaensis]|uniref:uncharacterized protein n=1 Tax=Aspergillus karnatakaensis TaxID=1810916 RepID=UPI003CCD08E6
MRPPSLTSCTLSSAGPTLARLRKVIWSVVGSGALLNREPWACLKCTAVARYRTAAVYPPNGTGPRQNSGRRVTEYVSLDSSIGVTRIASSNSAPCGCTGSIVLTRLVQRRVLVLLRGASIWLSCDVRTYFADWH